MTSEWVWTSMYICCVFSLCQTQIMMEVLKSHSATLTCKENFSESINTQNSKALTVMSYIGALFIGGGEGVLGCVKNVDSLWRASCFALQCTKHNYSFFCFWYETFDFRQLKGGALIHKYDMCYFNKPTKIEWPLPRICVISIRLYLLDRIWLTH